MRIPSIISNKSKSHATFLADFCVSPNQNDLQQLNRILRLKIVIIILYLTLNNKCVCSVHLIARNVQLYKHDRKCEDLFTKQRISYYYLNGYIYEFAFYCTSYLANPW